MKKNGFDFFHPLVFFPLAGLAVFAPCLLAGRAYFDGDLLAYYVPARIYLKSCLAQGHLPLWCPYVLGGQPFFADPNTMSAYPFTYLLLPLPVPYGFSLFYFLHFILAAWGTFFWARNLGLSRESALLAGLLLVFSGFFWWEIIHPPLLAAFAWMPWWGAALEKFSERLEPFWAFATGLAFALVFLSGNFQMTLGALYGGGLYLAYRLLARREWRKGGQKDQRLLKAPFFFLWGALPLLLLWIPAREFLGLSDRFHATPHYESFQADLSLDPRALTAFLFPVRPYDPATGEAKPFADYLANAGYLGPWALFFFALGVARRKGMSGFWAATGSLAVLTALGKYFPLHHLLVFLAPGFEWMRSPFRYLFLYVLAGSLLAAWGFEAFREGRDKELKKWFWKGAVPYAFFVLALGFWKGRDFLFQCPAVVLGCGSLWLWLYGKKYRKEAPKAFLLSLLLALLPTAWFSSSSRFGPPSSFDYAGRSKELRVLAEDARGGRALIGDGLPYPVENGDKVLGLELPADSVLTTRTRIAFGYNPLSLDRTTDLYSLPPPTFLRLMAIHCYATAAGKWKIPGFAVERRDGVAYGLNSEKTPFVYSPEKVLVAADGSELQAMRDPAFSPYRSSYLSEGASTPPKEKGPEPSLQYDWVRDDPDGEVFKVDPNRPGWAVFSEVMYPGWKAWVDGAPTALATANHCFRAVWLPGGTHEVAFRYEPVWWKPLLIGLCAWVLSVAGLAWGPWRKKLSQEFRTK